MLLAPTRLFFHLFIALPDAPFYEPDLAIVVSDAMRPGHEKMFYPGETNARMADLNIINKARSR